MCRGPLKNVTYELVLDSPVESHMSSWIDTKENTSEKFLEYVERYGERMETVSNQNDVNTFP